MRELRKVKIIMLSRNGCFFCYYGTKKAPFWGAFLLSTVWCDLADSAATKITAVGDDAFVVNTVANGESPHVDAVTDPRGGYVASDGLVSALFHFAKFTCFCLGRVDKQVHFVAGVGTILSRIVGQRNFDTERFSKRGSTESCFGERTSSTHDFSVVKRCSARFGGIDTPPILSDEHGAFGNGIACTDAAETDFHGRIKRHRKVRDGTKAGAIELLFLGAGIAGTAVVDGEHVEGTPLATNGVTEFVADGAKIASEINCHNFLILGVNV